MAASSKNFIMMLSSLTRAFNLSGRVICWIQLLKILAKKLQAATLILAESSVLLPN